MRTYFVILKKNDKDNQIRGVLFPEFPYLKLTEEQLATIKLASMFSERVSSLIGDCINAHIIVLQKNAKAIPDPIDFSELAAKNKVTGNDCWMPVQVNEPKKEFFAKGMPKLGAVSAVVSQLAGIITGAFALILFFRGSDNKTSVGATIFSLYQSIVNASMNLIIYFYARSGKGLEKVGEKFDILVRKIMNKRRGIVPSPEFVDKLPELKHCKTSTKVILTKIAAAGFVPSTIIFGNLMLYEQLDSMASDPNNKVDLLPLWLVEPAIIAQASTGIVSGLSFMGFMVSQVVDDLIKLYYSQIPFEIDANAFNVAVLDEKKAAPLELQEVRVDSSAAAAAPLELREVRVDSSAAAAAASSSGRVKK